MLTKWVHMDDLGVYLDRRGAIEKDEKGTLSDQAFTHLTSSYWSEVKQRIERCRDLLKEHDTFLVSYTLAQLFDRLNEDESDQNYLKRPVRYYAIRALRRNRRASAAWALLAQTYAWLGLPFVCCREREGRRYPAGYFAKAIRCMEQAIRITPWDENLRSRLSYYYDLRDQEFKPEGETRTFDCRNYRSHTLPVG